VIIMKLWNCLFSVIKDGVPHRNPDGAENRRGL
jgi:hypothetical protein